MSKKEDLLKAVTFLFVLFGKEPEKMMIDVYIAKLEPFDSRDIQVAVDKCIEECKFMPTIAELLANLKPSKGDLSLLAQEQWSEFYVAVVSRSNPTFDDPLTAYIAEKVLSIWALKNGSEDDLKFAQKKFVDAYADCLKNKAEIEAKCLRGEIKIISEWGVDKLNQEEDMRLGCGNAQIGEGS